MRCPGPPDAEGGAEREAAWPHGPAPVDVIGNLHPIALPPPRPGNWYVVSRLLALAVSRVGLVFSD